MSLTNTGEDGMLDMFAASDSWELALFTSDPGESGDTSGEVSGGAYARQSVSFGSASGGSISNDAGIDFPTATGSWGTVSHWGLMDSGGDVIWYGAVTVPKAITTGDIYRVPVGGLTLTLD